MLTSDYSRTGAPDDGASDTTRGRAMNEDTEVMETIMPDDDDLAGITTDDDEVALNMNYQRKSGQ
jgi:hypothetical protein